MKRKIPKAARARVAVPPRRSAPFWWEAGGRLQRAKRGGAEEQQGEMSNTFGVGRRIVRTGQESGAERGVRQRGEQGGGGHRGELQLANGATAVLSATGGAAFHQPRRAEGEDCFCRPLSQRHQAGSCRREEPGEFAWFKISEARSRFFISSGGKSEEQEGQTVGIKYGGPKRSPLTKNS